MWGPTFYLTSFSQPGPAGTTHLHPAAERRKRCTRMPSTQQNKRKTLRRCNFFCCVTFPSQNLPQQSPLELRTRTFQKPTAREEAKNKPKAKNFVDGFLTPNVADTRNPLVVVLHNGCVAATAGGLTPEGKSEKFTVNLLSEEPDMPSAGRMLEILAGNPVAQAKFFIISVRLFLEHVLGVMPFDEQLRANGTRASVAFPDGAASEFVGGSFPAIQQLHGPIEEQARLACHPHIVLHFVNRASQAWVRKILLAETEEAKELLRNWQQKTLLAVESGIQLRWNGSFAISTSAFCRRCRAPTATLLFEVAGRRSFRWWLGRRCEGSGKETYLGFCSPPVIDGHVRRHLAGESVSSFEETKKRRE